MNFKFNLGELKKGTLESLVISREVGTHSSMLLEYTLNENIPDLGGLLGDEIDCSALEGQGEEQPIFTGVITGIEYSAAGSGTVSLRLEAQSKSVLADMIPRSRVFQDPTKTLGDVVNEVIKGFHTIVEKHVDDILSQKDVLTIQFNETDFDYLQRIIEVHGAPIIIDDINNTVHIGQPDGTKHKITKKQITGKSYRGNVVSFASSPSFSKAGGVIGDMQESSKEFYERYHKDLPPLYTTSSAYPEAQKQHEGLLSVSDSSRFYCQGARCLLETKPAFFAVGDPVEIDNDSTPYSVYATEFAFDSQFGARSRHTLVASSVIEVDRDPIVHWHGDSFLAKVVENHGDPEDLGRIQVEFDWEESSSEDRCWVDVLTPYAGNKDNQTFGFLSLPEKGENVLVRFMESWDDKPYVIGSLRRSKLPSWLHPDRAKVIITPKGTQISLLTEDDYEVVRIQAGDGSDSHIEVRRKDNSSEVKINSSEGNLVLEARDQLVLKASDIFIKGEQGIEIDAQKALEISGKTTVNVKGPKINLKN